MILLVDNDTALAARLGEVLQLAGHEVQVAADCQTALAALDGRQVDLLVSGLRLPDDPRGGLTLLRRIRDSLPETETIVIADHDSIADALEAVRSGAFYFAEKPCDPDRLLLLVEKAIERRRLVAETRRLRGYFQPHDFARMIGSSKPMQLIYAIIESVAKSEANVLIHGEPGTGKDLIASAIHLNSRRAGRQFVRVSCRSLAHGSTTVLPPDIVEAEIFGRVAETGITAERGGEGASLGLIARAANGTLLLDEVDALPLELQPKLLRVIEERRYRPVGSVRMQDADFRLICTTNRDPREAILERLLRDDLFYRISTISLYVPPLRERGEDLQMLTEALFQEFREKYDRPLHGISPSAFRRILAHHWPGNVRELRNAIERAVLLARSSMIEPEDLPFIQPEPPVHPDGERASPPEGRILIPPDLTLEEVEQMVIRQALQRTGGNKLAAARILGLHRPRLYAKIRKYRLDLTERPQTILTRKEQS